MGIWRPLPGSSSVASSCGWGECEAADKVGESLCVSLVYMLALSDQDTFLQALFGFCASSKGPTSLGVPHLVGEVLQRVAPPQQHALLPVLRKHLAGRQRGDVGGAVSVQTKGGGEGAWGRRGRMAAVTAPGWSGQCQKPLGNSQWKHDVRLGSGSGRQSCCF